MALQQLTEDKLVKDIDKRLNAQTNLFVFFCFFFKYSLVLLARTMSDLPAVGILVFITPANHD